MKLYYNEQIIDASQKELIKFSKWMNRHHGNYPVIVGGWAVYAHLTKVSGFVPLGSRDIDVVFPSRHLMDHILLTYFRYHGFKREKKFLEASYIKEVKTPLGLEQIFIDACTLQDVREISELKIKIPWRLVGQYNELFEISPKTFIYVPAIELLLAQKIGACIERIIQRKTAPSNYLESKIWKDCYDVVNLTARRPVNKIQLKIFLKQAKLNKHLEILYKELQAQKEVLAEAKTGVNKLKQKIGF